MRHICKILFFLLILTTTATSCQKENDYGVPKVIEYLVCSYGDAYNDDFRYVDAYSYGGETVYYFSISLSKKMLTNMCDIYNSDGALLGHGNLGGFVGGWHWSTGLETFQSDAELLKHIWTNSDGWIKN